MKLKWNSAAIEDQRAIVAYCKKQFGAIVSIEVRERIRHSAKLLKSHPHLGRVDPMLVGCTSLEYRSLVVDKVTKIVYTVHAEYVYIHLLWDVRRDEEFLPQSLLHRYKDFESDPIWASEPPVEYGKSEDLGE